MRGHGATRDVHNRVAQRLLADAATPVLDVGCGEGELACHLPRRAWVGADASPTMLAGAPEPHVHADATALPFKDGSFGGVALLYVLHHLPDPRPALADAHRVLRPGGMLAVAAPSRHGSPELAHLVRSRPLTFDAEMAARLIAERFVEVDVDAWEPRAPNPADARVRPRLPRRAPGRARSRRNSRACCQHAASRHQRGAVVLARKAR